MTITCFCVAGICLLMTGFMAWSLWGMIKEQPIMGFFLVPCLIISAVPIFMYFKLQDTEPQESNIQLKEKPVKPLDITDPKIQYLHHKFIESMIWEK